MSVSQKNVLGSVTANVIQGLAKRSDFTWMNVAPAIDQNGLSVNWPVIKIEGGEMLRDNMEAREFSGHFKQVDANIELDTSTVSGDGFEIPIDSSIAADTTKRGLDIMSTLGLELMRNAWRMNERKVAEICQGTAFDTVNPVANYTQANIETIDPALDIQNAIETVMGRGEYVTDISIPIEVWNRIRFSKLLQNFISGSVNPGAGVTPENLRRAFADYGIERVNICRARVNVAAKKKVDIEPIWKSSHIYVGAGVGAEAETGSANSIGSAVGTFYSDEQPEPFFLEEYYSNERRSHVLRVYGETNVKQLNARAGTRIVTNFA